MDSDGRRLRGISITITIRLVSTNRTLYRRNLLWTHLTTVIQGVSSFMNISCTFHLYSGEEKKKQAGDDLGYRNTLDVTITFIINNCMHIFTFA